MQGQALDIAVWTRANSHGRAKIGCIVNFNGENSHLLSTVQITSDDVYNKIIKLKDGKAPGDDGFVPVS